VIKKKKALVGILTYMFLAQGAQAADLTALSPYWNNFEFQGNRVQMSLRAARQRTFLNELVTQPTALAIDTAQSEIISAESSFDPTVTLSTTRSSTQNEVTPTQTVNDTASLTVSKAFQTGTVLSASGSYTQADSTTNTNDLATDQVSKSVSLTQPLLKDAGGVVNALSIRTAEKTFDSQKMTHIDTMSGKYLAVTNAYWDHWLAFQSLNIALEQYELAKQQTVLAQKLADAGLAANVEVLRAETGVAQRMDAILQAQNNIIATNNVLSKLVSSEESEEIYTLIQPTSEPEVTEPKLNKRQLLDEALNNSLSIKILENSTDSAQMTLEAAEHQLLPEVDFNATYTETDGKTDNKSVKFNSSEKDDWTVGLTLTYPFMQRADNEAHKQALINLKTVRYSLATQRQTIAKNVDLALNSIYQSYRKLVAAIAEEEITQRIYRAEVQQFNQGQQTSTDVLNAAQQLAVAQNKKASAKVDFEKNKTQINYIRGALNQTVMEFLNIE